MNSRKWENQETVNVKDDAGVSSSLDKTCKNSQKTYLQKKKLMKTN